MYNQKSKITKGSVRIGWNHCQDHLIFEVLRLQLTIKYALSFRMYA